MKKLVKPLLAVSFTALALWALVMAGCDNLSGGGGEKPPKTYTLTIDVAPAGGGTVTRIPEMASYNDSDIVIIMAVPASGYEFKNWTGGRVDDASSEFTTVEISGNTRLTANFVKTDTGVVVTYTLTLLSNPAAGGTVARDPDRAFYSANETVFIMATAAAGYSFFNWTGGEVADTILSTTTVTMEANTTLTANFRQQ